MRWALGLLVTLFVFPAAAALGDEAPALIVVVGAEGTPEYGEAFRSWANRWSEAAKQAGAKCTLIGMAAHASDSAAKSTDATEEEPESPPAELTDREQLEKAFAAANETSETPLWVILIGHGTYDGKTARFNLRGPDISPDDLQTWLKGVDRPVAIVNCASCSGPFMTKLSGPRRVIITATKSGHEYNYARLGDYLSTAITDPAGDLDKDEQTSLLEAYLVAAAKVREFYASDSRLATEHALLDDNGDGLGTPGEFFQGLRPAKAAKNDAALDGALAQQFVLVRSARERNLPEDVRAKRDALEKSLAELRPKREELGEEAYLALIEPILVELARLLVAAEKNAAP